MFVAFAVNASTPHTHPVFQKAQIHAKLHLAECCNQVLLYMLIVVAGRILYRLIAVQAICDNQQDIHWSNRCPASSICIHHFKWCGSLHYAIMSSKMCSNYISAFAFVVLCCATKVPQLWLACMLTVHADSRRHAQISVTCDRL